jgi:hypothetical protein
VWGTSFTEPTFLPYNITQTTAAAAAAAAMGFACSIAVTGRCVGNCTSLEASILEWTEHSAAGAHLESHGPEGDGDVQSCLQQSLDLVRAAHRRPGLVHQVQPLVVGLAPKDLFHRDHCHTQELSTYTVSILQQGNTHSSANLSQV